ncbi:MAG: hypothetical protein ACKKL6_00470 [Candidatus Komeilibacteria bacterium]
MSARVRPKGIKSTDFPLFRKIEDLIVAGGTYDGMRPFGITWGHERGDVPVVLLHNPGTDPWTTKVPFSKINTSLINTTAA